MKNKTYRRLPGRGTTFSHYVRFFQGTDHLLQVSSTGYSEIYKRFYYRDIQAIIIRQTHIGKIWNALWGFPAGVFGLIALAMELSGVNGIVLWVMAGILGLGALINIVLGPTCVCHVRTAVQTEKLPTLKRLRSTRPILQQLKPLITSVQGELSAEDIRLKLQPSAFTPASPATPAPPVIEQSPKVPPVVSGGA